MNVCQNFIFINYFKKYTQSYNIKIRYMERLKDLTANIRKWNTMGYSLLPPLQLAIVFEEPYKHIFQFLVQSFQCDEILYTEGQESSYIIYKQTNGIQAKVHIVKGIIHGNLKDSEFKKRKIIIQKLRRRKDIIFIKFVSDRQFFWQEKQQSQLLGVYEYSMTRDIIFTKVGKSSFQALCFEIIKRYESISRLDLLTNYREIRQLQKKIKKEVKDYEEIKNVGNDHSSLNGFLFLCHQRYRDFLTSNIEGIYDVAVQISQKRSLRWQIFQLLEALWQIQGESLVKEIQSYPLSFIEQQYKMSNYHSIGGFLPDTCFRNIFSPPLKSFQREIISTLKSAKWRIMKTVENIVMKNFKYTNIMDEFLDKQLFELEKICDEFLLEFQKNIQSQINYVHASADDFWSFRSVQSQLFSPNQQIYLQIKYIGKTYVKKVFQTVQDSVPRYLGQVLLKKIIYYLQKQSFPKLLHLTQKIPFQIYIQAVQKQRLERTCNQLAQINKLEKYFSLKVNGSAYIKNLQDRQKREWNRMFGQNLQKGQEQEERKNVRQGGFVNWMKGVLGVRNIVQNNNKVKRSSSLNRNTISKEIQKDQQQNPQIKRKKFINTKQWLILLNTDKRIQEHKLFSSAKKGFPPKMRSSIWLYIVRHYSSETVQYKVSDILSKSTATEENIRIINKDVNRTFPHNLFKGVLKKSLTNVLQAYSIIDQQLAYTQGMNFIAGAIMAALYNFEQQQPHFIQLSSPNYQELQEKTFAIFKYLLKEKGVRRIMFIERETLVQICWRLQQAIKDYSPELHQMISSSGFTIQILFTSSIISCLSGQTMEFKIKKRIFDLLIVQGFGVIYKVIALFAVQTVEYLKKQPPERIYEYLRNKMYDEVWNRVGQEGLTKMFANL